MNKIIKMVPGRYTMTNTCHRLNNYLNNTRKTYMEGKKKNTITKDLT